MRVDSKFVYLIANVRSVYYYARSPVMMNVDLAQVELRDNENFILPEVGKINNETGTIMFDSGAEYRSSILPFVIR